MSNTPSSPTPPHTHAGLITSQSTCCNKTVKAPLDPPVVRDSEHKTLTKREGPELPIVVLVIACNRVDYLRQTLDRLLE